MKKKVLTVFLVLSLIVLGFSISKRIVLSDDFNRLNNHDVNREFNEVTPSNYISYTKAQEEEYNIDFEEKIIMFNSAEELYDWSQDLKYGSTLASSIKNKLANANYALGADIDYSIMKARRFMPIGYNFSLEGVTEQLTFTGTFDGRGFEISELELEIYSNFNIEHENTIHVFSPFFSMFTYNGGTIKELGLIDPIIDLNNEHVTLRDFSYLVGKNTGTVKNSYVIDTRPFGQAGMNVSAMRTEATTQKRAAGLVHTNEGLGVVKNSFFSGVSVINRQFMHVILEEPVFYFDNNNSIEESVIYNETKYGEGVTSNLYQIPVNGTAIEESDIINNNNNNLEEDWYYYSEEDGTNAFPKRFGLNLNNDDQYLITNGRDLITFSKLLTFSTISLNNKGFNEQTYFVENDINMDDVSPKAYQISENEFLGTLTASSTQAQINNFIINEGLNIGSGYHLGMFYLLGGTVSNLKLYNHKIIPTTTTDYTGQMFYVGSIASKLTGGTIENISLKSHIDFTSEGFKIGAYTIGSVVGEASGTIEKVYVSDESEIVFKKMEYDNTNNLTPNFYLGGVIGKSGSNKLNAYNILNEGKIENLDVAADLYIANNVSASFHVGGVIGNINNTSLARHNIGLLTNSGNITTHSLVSVSFITTYLGGVIGLSSGTMYDFTNTYGAFTNEGEFIYNNNTNKTLYVAGVLNSNHSEQVEFVQIDNENDINVTQNNVFGSALINHLSNNKITISQAKSKGSITYSGVQRQDIQGAIYTSSKTTELQLNYVDVKTNLSVDYNNNSSDLNIAGVTLNENANYLNVTYGGLLEVEVKGNNTSVIWVSGITKQLSANKVMKNSMNEGTIHAYARTTNTNNSIVKNLYVGGLVNINESGDLHTQTGEMPTATKGIINSINRAKITSYFKDYKGIDGRINTFAAGIATINRGSIQDVVNIGDIRFSNITNGTQGDFVEIDGSESHAGKTNMYKTGVVTGGIVSVVTIGNSRIYDSINSGDVIAQSYYYARSGGILGVVSPFDVSAGDVHEYTENNNAADPNHLKHSVISNGINYGNIYAITSVIGEYATGTLGSSARLYQNTSGNYTWPNQVDPSINMQTRDGSSGRIAIHSAAGGITGSGLSVLKRMINHGQIGATDAAGGIIGSIFVYADQNWRSAGRGTTAVGVTIVNINTAINYGDIRAIRRHSSGTNNSFFNAIYNNTTSVISEIQVSLHGYNDDFINPTNPRNTAHANSIRLFPEHKRGIGGIIGRIQRGGNQNMITNYDGVEFYNGPDLRSEEGSFDFIVNMNPNVDLIGRLDQNYNFSLSATAFHFHDAIYYSAKPNDTTQAVFTGFLINQNMTGYYVQGPNANVSVTTSGSFWNRTYHYNVTGNVVAYQNANYNGSYLQKGQVLKDDGGNFSYSDVYSTNSSFTINNSSEWSVYDVPGGKFIATSSGSSSDRTFGNAKPVPFITETPSGNSEEYVYHEDFVMRDEDTTLTTGESITDYIYYAAVDLLADRFQATRPNGMYVLSTTAGSTFGSVLPRNFNANKLSKICDQARNDLDYENVPDDCLNLEDDSFEELLNLYQNQLYQTILNDKSALLEENQYFSALGKDEQGNINLGTVFNDGTADIDYTNKKVGLIIDRMALGDIRYLDFEILEALIPENALIARQRREGEGLEEFQGKLQAFREQNPNAIVATGDLAPYLVIDGEPENNIDYPVGDGFVSYSEAALMDQNFTGNSTYFTEYELYVRFVASNASNPPHLNQISTDGDSFSTTLTNREFTENFTMRFRDQYGILQNGHKVDEYIKIYYQDDENNLHEVEKEYYIINSDPKTGEYFDTNIEFDYMLRDGVYVVSYKIFAQQEEDDLTINYDPDRTHEIYEFSPYTSTTYDGLTADFAFGYELDFESPCIENTHEGKVYLARHTYTIPFLERFSASTYFEIESIDIFDETSGFYKKYKVVFNLKDGTSVERFIEESELSPVYYKNNVGIPSKEEVGYLPTVAENFVTREAERTTFSLIYNMSNHLYDVNNFIVTVDNIPITETSSGVYYNVNNNRLNIIFDDSPVPGEYIVRVKFIRDNSEIEAGNLIITKRQGTSAYLENIKFSEFVPGIEYPKIYAVTENNVSKLTQYELGIYYRGIDYNETDTQKHQYYRIDGEVAGVPLNEYMPIDIVDYLPLGAKIQRKYYIDGVAYWTDLVDELSTEEEILESLTTDFTVDPKTGNLEFDTEGNALIPYVEYRVVSEDGNNEVIYYISVRDIVYSFLAVFNYYYFDGENYYPVDDVEALNNELLILNIYNYNVKYEDELLKDDYVVTTEGEDAGKFPLFDEIVSINSTMTQFYHIVYGITNDLYMYGFGTNFSGFYHFYLDTDKEYQIYEGTAIEAKDLPLISDNIEGLDGYYYYINASPVTRTRYFTIVITDDPVDDDSWGLTDSSK